MKILTAAQMREVDRLTTERHRIPSLLLMENAAARTAEAIERRFGPVAGRYVTIVCGKGNNGGDGAAIARQLWMRGALVDVLLLGRAVDARGDARVNFDAVRALAESSEGLGFREIETGDDLWEDAAFDEADLYVDAIFGTGLSRPAEGVHAEAIDMLNEVDGPVVAVDIPSGLASDDSNPIGPHVRAALTVTFTAPKPACVLPPAAFACGELVTAHIGSAESIVSGVGSQLNLVEPSTIARYLAETRRGADAHKGDAGAVLIVAGSPGKTGAAAMTAEAALRAGAGLVTVAAPRSIEPALAARTLPEAMTEPLAETADGVLGKAVLAAVREMIEARDVVAIGPGLGRADETRELVVALVRERSRPIVIDADGLNCLAPWPSDLRATDELPIVVTPHPAEMARLLGCTTKEVVADRVAAASRFAAASGAVTVLKGARTVVASPGGASGTVFVNPTGNAGMATGGSGDVLTGVVAALLAQRPNGGTLDAVVAAVYLHGLAGDLAVRETGTRSLVATDIAARLGAAFVEAGGDAERG
jgi:ADP-dependent NAD(P)H-hydrate dehydratase / NAD(P)H-hydrate epimerase